MAPHIPEKDCSGSQWKGNVAPEVLNVLRHVWVLFIFGVDDGTRYSQNLKNATSYNYSVHVVISFSRSGINDVWLPTPLVVSWTGKLQLILPDDKRPLTSDDTGSFAGVIAVNLWLLDFVVAAVSFKKIVASRVRAILSATQRTQSVTAHVSVFGRANAGYVIDTDLCF